MRRVVYVVLAAGMLIAMSAWPAFAGGGGGEPVIDPLDFIPVQFQGDFEDRNDDGIPDFKDIPPEGIAGIWADRIGALTPEEFLSRVDPGGESFKTGDTGSSLIGPCGGIVITYDADGQSIDAAVDFGDERPPVDIYGNQAMTSSNELQVDTGGDVLYFGFNGEFTVDPATGAIAFDEFTFHNWQSFIRVQGVAEDREGDPNPRDKNRNAGSVDLGGLLPFDFTAKVKIKGAMVDGFGPRPPNLPDQETYAAVHCLGEGWIKFVGPYPLFTAPGALALALAAAGFIGLLTNARPALTWRG